MRFGQRLYRSGPRLGLMSLLQAQDFSAGFASLAGHAKPAPVDDVLQKMDLRQQTGFQPLQSFLGLL